MRRLVLTSVDIATQVLPLLFTGATVILGILQPQHNPLKNTISELVLGTGGWLMTLFFIVFGLTYCLFSYRIWVTFKGRPRALEGAALLTIMGFSFIIIALCPTEPGGIGDSDTGVIHVIAAGTAICVFPLAAYCIWKNTGRESSSLHSITIATIAAGILLSLGTCAGLLSGASWKGAVERVMALNGLVWFQAVGYHLFKHHPIPSINLSSPSDTRSQPRALTQLIVLPDVLHKAGAAIQQKYSRR